MSAADRQEKEKSARKKIILASARKLFQNFGFAMTTMNAISKESEYTCKTIYNYFSSKEDLFFATIYLDYYSLFDTMKANQSTETTGFKKIERVVLTYQQFSELNKTFISNTVKANELSNNIRLEEATPYQIKYMNLYKEIFNFIATLFYLAQEDASIRTDLDATKLAISTIITVTGFLNMQELTSERFNSRFGLSENEITDFTISRLLENLKS